MIPWTGSVKQSGKLTIYLAPLAGSWGHVFRDALRAFNALCSTNKLGITITESKVPPEHQGGANISVRAASGAVSATYDGETRSENFDGARLHGRTLLFYRAPQNVVEKAFIFLPTEPKVNTPQGQRPVGVGVMKVIAAHELLHACGLEDADHSSDLFQANPRVDAGTTAASDKVLIGTGPKSMPPLLLDGATVQNVIGLWAK